MAKEAKILATDGPACKCGGKEFVVANRLKESQSMMLECTVCGTYRLATEAERREAERALSRSVD